MEKAIYKIYMKYVKHLDKSDGEYITLTNFYNEIVTDVSSRLEKLVSPHTEHFEQWLNKYFKQVDDNPYKDKNGNTYTLSQLHKKFEKAMLESPFVSG